MEDIDKTQFMRDIFGLSLEQIHIPKSFVQITNNFVASVILAKIVWFDVYSRAHKNFGDGKRWFYYTDSQWQEWGISTKKRRTAQALLVRLGLIWVEKKGLPAKNYYAVNLGRIYDLAYPEAEPTSQTEQHSLDNAEQHSLDNAEQHRHTYKEKNKEKEKKEGSSSSSSKGELGGGTREELLAPALGEANASGREVIALDLIVKNKDRLVGWKTLSEKFSMPEWKAKQVAKDLKDMDVGQREEVLINLMEGQGYGKPKKKKQQALIVWNSLTAEKQSAINANLEWAKSIYEKELGIKAEITDILRDRCAKARQERRITKEELERYVQGICRTYKETNSGWFSVPFHELFDDRHLDRLMTNPQIMHEKKVDTFIF